jgi:hypothetical protein
MKTALSCGHDLAFASPAMSSAEPATGRLIALWLETALLVRVGGRTVDLDAGVPEAWEAAIVPLRAPVTLVTAWNPRGRETPGDRNRAANRRLRDTLDARGWTWRPALGRARGGSWAEPGFAVGGLTRAAAAALGAEWDQLAVYVVTAEEVIVLASDRSFRRTRRRGRLAGA